jgi:hypothetical protein
MPIKFDIDTANQKESILRYILSDGDLEDAIMYGKIQPKSFEKLINNTKNVKFWCSTIGKKLSAKSLAKIVSQCKLKESFLLDFFDCLTTEKLAEIFNVENLSIETIYKYLKERASADRAQAVLYKMAEKTYFKRLAEILTYGANDVTLTANTTYSGINRFRDLNLNGYTYTADGQPHIIIARDIYIPSSSVLTKTASNPVDQPGSGYPGSPGYYILDTSQYPKGGSGGGVWSPPAAGGGGGGGIDGAGGGGYQSGGVGGGALLLVLENTIQIAIALYYTVIDWYIVNILGKTPSDTVQIQNLRAATGGRGGRSADGASGGLGGNGGGGLMIFCRNLYNYGTISANGANGANGAGSSYPGAIYSGGGGGGGGAGGLIYVVTHSIVHTGSTVSKGGNGGKGGDADPLWGDGGGGGGGGSGGIIYFFYSKSVSSISGTFDVSGGSGGAGGSAGYSGGSGSSGQTGIVRLYSY